jgi:hypothetical protein
MSEAAYGSSAERSSEAQELTIEDKRRVVESIKSSISQEYGSNNLELVETASMGSGDSAHDVFFAHGNSRKGEKDIAVAIKTFTKQTAAERELSNLQEVEARGFQTVQPIGKGLFELQDGLGTALMTEFVQGLVPMNRLPWHGRSGKYNLRRSSKEQLSGTLRQVGRFVGSLHRGGIVHHDLQLKNIGQVFPNDFVVYDVESAQFFNEVPKLTSTYIRNQNMLAEGGLGFAETKLERESEKYARSCVKDVGVLLRSLSAACYLKGQSDDDFNDEMYFNLLSPYFDAGGHPAIFEPDNYNMLMNKAVDIRHDSYKLNNSHEKQLA